MRSVLLLLFLVSGFSYAEIPLTLFYMQGHEYCDSCKVEFVEEDTGVIKADLLDWGGNEVLTRDVTERSDGVIAIHYASYRDILLFPQGYNEAGKLIYDYCWRYAPGCSYREARLVEL